MARQQNEITAPEPLHKEDGTLSNPGFARAPYQTYDRSLVRASRLRRKEWDYYLVSDGSCTLCLTIADLGYAALYSVSLIDFFGDTFTFSSDGGTSTGSAGLPNRLFGGKGYAAPEGSRASSKTTSVIDISPLAVFGKSSTTDSGLLPLTSTEGISSFENGKIKLKFTVNNSNQEDKDENGNGNGNKKTERRLEVYVRDFCDGNSLTADIVLSDEPRDSMVIATPFKNRPHSFFYNRKIVGMTAKGVLTYAGKTHVFNPDHDPDPNPSLQPEGTPVGEGEGRRGSGGGALGLLDWGRGVWTRDNTWYWAAAHGHHVIDGRRVVIGFNLGYGFGDTAAATENMFFVDGVAHKLDEVDFGIPDDNNDNNNNDSINNEKNKSSSSKEGKDGKKKKKTKPSFLKPWTFTSNDDRLAMTFSPIVDRIDYINLGLVVSDQHQVMGRCAGRVTLDDGSVLEFSDLLATAEKIRNKW